MARSASAAEPHLHITSTDSPVLAQPYVQIRGYSETALAWLSYTVIDASGGTNSRGYITQQHYDPKLFKFTTNWWQCFDVELAPGFNRVVIQAVDRLGQSNSTTLHFAQLYLPNRPEPQPAVAFPVATSRSAARTSPCAARLIIQRRPLRSKAPPGVPHNRSPASSSATARSGSTISRRRPAPIPST